MFRLQNQGSSDALGLELVLLLLQLPLKAKVLLNRRLTQSLAERLGLCKTLGGRLLHFVVQALQLLLVALEHNKLLLPLEIAHPQTEHGFRVQNLRRDLW